MQDCNDNKVIQFKKKQKIMNPATDLSIINKEALIAEINKLPDGELTNFAIVCCIGGSVYRAYRTDSYFTLMGELEDLKTDLYVWENQ